MQVQRADQPDTSERGFRKVLKRFREKSGSAVVRGLRGRRSNRRSRGKIAPQALEAVKRQHRAFGPDAGSRVLAKDLQMRCRERAFAECRLGGAH